MPRSVTYSPIGPVHREVLERKWNMGLPCVFRFRSSRYSVVLLLLVLCAVLFSPSSSANREPQYDLEGTWSDACPCTVPCPCWRTQRASARRCVNLQVFHIEKGHFERFDLSGSTFVLAGVPADEYGTPDLYRVYSDPTLGSADVAALFTTAFGLPLGRGAETVPSIKAEIEASAHSVTIPELLFYEVAPETANGSVQPSPEVGPYLYPWIRDSRQWQTRRVNYNLDGKEVTYSGTNGLKGRFKITSVDE